jgi:hypothetical protein
MTVRYGAAFMRQYEGLDIAHVKADWAEVLDGTSGKSIAFGLQYLPSDRPPNAMQFRDQCRRAPHDDHIALPAPDVKPDPARVREVMAAIAPAVKARENASNARQCIAIIEAIVKERDGKMTVPQRLQLEACRKLVGEVAS